MRGQDRPIGARVSGEGVEFVVWAPTRDTVELNLRTPREEMVSMERDQSGYWSARVDGIGAGATYLYRLDGSESRPDPASAFQPEGVHGVSQVVDHQSFEWRDSDWQGMPLSEMIQYELHVGTFSPTQTFDGVAQRIHNLKQLGVTALAIMPVAQFPGSRNWGYDGTYPFAVQDSYGGPEGLKRLVNACHEAGMAVVLDVVYNHLGPEGNYLGRFAPYFTNKYRTPWGEAVNFDDAFSFGVRNYFVQNARHWFEHYHIDALRLDAIHGIYDFSAKHILEELVEAASVSSQMTGRECLLIAESDLNNARIILDRNSGGFGVHAQWSDDFHHSVHTLLTGEQDGYYADFGRMDDLVKAIREGFVYDWRFSNYRRRIHGSSSKDIPAERLVISLQTHDQVGNRMKGERLSHLVSFEAVKAAAAVMILSPYVPMLFMGEEYAESNPFYYFVSHSDKDLIEAVRRGRREEFESFGWDEELPDAQAEETFTSSCLSWESQENGTHKTMRDFYRQLIIYRKTLPSLRTPDKRQCEVWGEDSGVLGMHRWSDGHAVLCLFNLSGERQRYTNKTCRTSARKLLDSSMEFWSGPGGCALDRLEPDSVITLPPYGCVIYEWKKHQ